MTESIQFRGPLEVEGPDDLDDDDNYMRPGMETTSLQTRQQKQQPPKRSLYIAIVLFFLGLFYFYLTYESPKLVISEYATQTTFSCNREQYWTKQQCESNQMDCQLSVESSGLCVLCENEYLQLNGTCSNKCDQTNGQLCTQHVMVSNIFKPINHSEYEIPYILKYTNGSQNLLYFLDAQLFDINKYLNLTSHIVKFDDYYLLNNPLYHSAFTEFQQFIEKTMLDVNETANRTFVVHSDRAQGLLYYLKENNRTQDNVVMVQAKLLEDDKFYEERFEIHNFTHLLKNSTNQIKLLYTQDVVEGISCKKENRLLEETKDESREIDCKKVEENQIIENIVQP